MVSRGVDQMTHRAAPGYRASADQRNATGIRSTTADHDTLDHWPPTAGWVSGLRTMRTRPRPGASQVGLPVALGVVEQQWTTPAPGDSSQTSSSSVIDRRCRQCGHPEGPSSSSVLEASIRPTAREASARIAG
jgi:hypothetical protein